ATQHTLNRALGGIGGRQKSWMTSTSARVPTVTIAARTINSISPTSAGKRKRGRPRKYPNSDADALQPQLERAAVQLGRERHPPSNSTSPQLANVVSTAQSSSVSRPNTVLPSPSPSPDTTAENTHINPPALQTSLHNGETHDLHNMGMDAVSHRHLMSNMVFMNGLQQSALASPIGHTQSMDPRTTSSVESLAQSPSMGHFPIQSSVVGQDETRSPSLDHHTSTYPSPHLTQQGVQNRNQVGRTPPQVQGPFVPPPSFSRGVILQPYGVSASGSHGHSPTVPSPLVPAEYFTQLDCSRALNAFFSKEGIPAPESHDGRRLQVLKEAVNKQDWDYLTMHQYYCLLDTDPQSLSSNIVQHPNLNIAKALLGAAFDQNRTLHKAVLQFFANFPMPNTYIAKHFPRVHYQQEQMFIRFMILSAHYDSLMATCMERKFPPLVRELHQGLGITSPRLRRIVFTAVLRCMWAHAWGPIATQQKFENEALAIFDKNQNHFLRLQYSNRVPQNFENDDLHWAGPLRNVCERYATWLATFRQQNPQPRPQVNHIVPQPSTPQPRQLQTAQTAQIAIARGRIDQSRVYGPVQPTLQSQPAISIQPAQSVQQAALRSILPSVSYTQPQQRVPDPTRFGLHLASLRSPVLKAQSTGPALYQYVKAFLKSPARFKEAGRKIEKWTLPVASVSSIPRDIPGLVGAPASRFVTENSNLLRIRCVKCPLSEHELPNDMDWAIADTSWPPSTFFTFNGTHLQPRKKLYYGKDLPIDISALIKDGDNVLEIAVQRESHDEKYLDYALAVEVVGFTSHDTIKTACLTMNHIAATATLEEIRRRLSPTSDDDDIVIVESNLTISLFDPFSNSRICDIPARSKACLHIDCFDLETFLRTRTRKGDVSVPDSWKCPICKLDARPHHLIVDGFLENVRKKLEQDGLLQTRAIIVDRNGSWKPRIEAAPTGVSDRASPDEEEQSIP
ncbi:hypothetical protein K504DRAFT_339393, partial [Pleomassaria siparia CBS 279.74]